MGEVCGGEVCGEDIESLPLPSRMVHRESLIPRGAQRLLMGVAA